MHECVVCTSRFFFLILNVSVSYEHLVCTSMLFSYSKRTYETGNICISVSYVHLEYFFSYSKCTYESLIRIPFVGNMDVCHD